MNTENMHTTAIQLLQQLIATPSFSREESETASILETFFRERNIPTRRQGNNVWCSNKYFDENKPVILLNSHHDTVKPNASYTKDPFQPLIQDGKLYGLGSNDAGGPLVSLIMAFIYFYDKKDLAFNLVMAASAEEETSGKNGLEMILPALPPIAFAIVGEPTQTNLAIAEKGLLVLDCTVQGKSGHAAREEGENAIYKAMADLQWFRTYRFRKVSESLGAVKMSVTVINTENKAHNVVPGQCTFVVDVRVTDAYTHEDLLEEIQQHVQCSVIPRSMRMRSSRIDPNHPLVQAGIRLGKTTYGSPTTSDQALIAAPSVKCGPGDSARSHTADEFIYVEEIRQGIDTYIGMLEGVMNINKEML